MKKYHKLLPHREVLEILPSVYSVTGTMRLFGLFQYSRNMVILKEGSDLAIVNPVRVNEFELNKIRKLGNIKHIFKIGRLHSVDVPFYMDKFSPKLWVSEGDDALPEYKADYFFNEYSVLPFMKIKVIPIASSKLPETILLVLSDGGCLLSCDAFVNMTTDPMANWLTGKLSKLLPQPTFIGPNWIKLAKPPKKEMLQVLDHKFSHLVSAHGPPVLNDAYEQLNQYLKAYY